MKMLSNLFRQKPKLERPGGKDSKLHCYVYPLSGCKVQCQGCKTIQWDTYLKNKLLQYNDTFLINRFSKQETMKTENKLPESWCVKSCSSKEDARFNHVIDYLNKRNGKCAFIGWQYPRFYGERSAIMSTGEQIVKVLSQDQPFGKTLTIEEFIALSEVSSPEVKVNRLPETLTEIYTKKLESLIGTRKEKTITMSTETARRFWKGCNDIKNIQVGWYQNSMRNFLLENFTKKELEGNIFEVGKVYESYNGHMWFITDSNGPKGYGFCSNGEWDDNRERSAMSPKTCKEVSMDAFEKRLLKYAADKYKEGDVFKSAYNGEVFTVGPHERCFFYKNDNNSFNLTFNVGCIFNSDTGKWAEIIKVAKEGFTWEESFSGDGWYVGSGSEIHRLTNVKPLEIQKNLFATEKQALSTLAFAQLSHIVNKYNEGKTVPITFQDGIPHTFHPYMDYNGMLTYHALNHTCNIYHPPFGFYNKNDIETSLKTNKALWEQYWMR